MALVSYNATLNEWENIIRVKLKVTNPSLIKSGALGILTNYLAGIKYDALQFYSKTFQEMNVGLAQDFNSLMYHSTIYGTDLEFAVPATLSSSIVIPELNLGQTKEVVYVIPRYATFSDTNSLNYLYNSEIKLSITNKGMKASAWNPQQGTRKLTVTTAPNPNVPGSNVFLIYNDDAEQYQRTNYNFEVQAQQVGQNTEYKVGINSISKIKALYAWINVGRPLTTNELDAINRIDPSDVAGSFVGVPGLADADIKELDLRYFKFDSSVRDLHLFVQLFETSLVFETGDGLHGALFPEGAQIIIEVQTTQGGNGNVVNSEYILTDVMVQEKFGEGFVNEPLPTTINGLSTTGSYGGKNIQSADGIRQNIFNQINVRNSIITENDYERLFKYQDIKPFVDAKFLDAKAFVFIFNVIHDNDLVVDSTSINFKEAELLRQPFYPMTNYGGINLISPFYYKANSVNTIDAFIVDPIVTFSLNGVSENTINNFDTGYHADIALTYEFERTQDGLTGTSFIEVLGEPQEEYEYHFYCSWLGIGAYIPLNKDNGFKYEINSLYTDPYCIVHDITKNIRVEVFEAINDPLNIGNQQVLAAFEDKGQYHQLQKKQSFYKYFQELPDGELPDTLTSRDTIAYLDNSVEDIMSTINDVFEVQGSEHETYLLRLPFIAEDWFLGKPSSEIFEIMDTYFIVNYVEEDINYNTQLTQAFHNTIDVPSNYYPYLFEENHMDIITDPMMPIKVNLFVNQDAFLTSKYNTIFDFEIAVKIALVKLMKEQEGFMVDFYETDIEKTIYNEFSPLIRNIRMTMPRLFKVNNSSTIYNSLQENLSFQEVLDFVPPYFFYDYNNLELTIDM